MSVRKEDSRFCAPEAATVSPGRLNGDTCFWAMADELCLSSVRVPVTDFGNDPSLLQRQGSLSCCV